jgi:hypothetical protein
MIDPTHDRPRSAKILGAAGVGAAAIVLSSGVASADVEEVAPSPTVTSRQASEHAEIRINDYGVAGGISEARLAEEGVVNAQGEVRDSAKAVIGGRKSRPFRGSYPNGPGIGEW